MIELKQFNVLLVEDETDIREIFTNLLKLLFKNVYVAANGLEAVEVLKEEKEINLLITDINMPKMNGYDLIKFVKENFSSLPIIVTTAYANIDLVKKVKELNVQEYIIKPIDLVDLTNKSKSLLV